MKGFLVFVSLFSLILCDREQSSFLPSQLDRFIRNMAHAMTSRFCEVEITNLPSEIKCGQTILVQFKVLIEKMDDMIYEIEIYVQPKGFCVLNLTYLNPPEYRLVDLF
ncbi:hypothetical protein ACOME3_005857 [Neoechinorhynchus agilis]